MQQVAGSVDGLHDTSLDPQKFLRVTFQIDDERNAEDDDIRTKYNILYQSFWWRNEVYTPIRMRGDDGRLWGIWVKQWMVDNHARTIIRAVL